MRPYPDEILRSMQHSLQTYVIPNVNDKWGAYVAKVMKKMLLHLELRWKLEGPLLLEDTADLRALLTSLRTPLTAPVLAKDDDARELVARIDASLAETGTPPVGYVSIESLTETNEVLRETLVSVIGACDLLAERGFEATLAAAREEIGAYLRREVDRENQLVAPTFMSFAPASGD